MSARRAPSEPPVIPGFQPGRLLGMGGFADVFLYQQEMPRRPVAVKVLLASLLNDEVRERFRSEADLMATLSHHPSIVTVFQADVAADGRPYLVMEYCSRPGLGQRYRKERMSVPEVLRIGIRLAAAVETAHRAGILHRDIKPANVLVTDFGWPALTDFGIAATTSGDTGRAVGMSIPWSPPELLAEHPTGDVRSDVYSLAATVYSLLVGRSPFEVVGGPNTAADLIARIERMPLAPTGRADVPWELQEAVARAMDRDPARRFHSAMAFGRALQHVEGQMSLSRTPLDLPDEIGSRPDGDRDMRPGATDNGADAGQATRLRPVMVVAPDGPARPVARRGPAAPVAPDAPESLLGPDEPETVVGPDRGPLPKVAVVLVGIVLLVALVRGAWGAFSSPVEPLAVDPAGGGSAPIVRAVPAPTDLTGVIVDGIATFTWTNPDPLAGDRYLWAPAEVGTAAAGEIVDVMTVSLPADDQVCIEVALVRSDRRYSNVPATGCAEP